MAGSSGVAVVSDARPAFDDCLGHFTYHPVTPGVTAFCNRCGHFLVLNDEYDWLSVPEPGETDPTRQRFYFSGRPWDDPTFAPETKRETQREIEIARGANGAQAESQGN